MLREAIYKLGVRIRLFRVMGQREEPLTEREYLILILLSMKERLTIAEITSCFPQVSANTISLALNKLWKTYEFISKGIDPDNPRATKIFLSKKGAGALEKDKKAKLALYDLLINALQLTEEEKQIWEKSIERATGWF